MAHLGDGTGAPPAGALVAAVVAVPSANAVTPAACPDTAVFETDGYGNGESLANWNRSGFNANPPAGWQVVQVPYYAGVFPVVDRQALDASVAEGTAKLERAVLDPARRDHAGWPGLRRPRRAQRVQRERRHLQQLLGGNAGVAELRAARDGLAALVGQPMLDRLTANSPWYKIIATA